MDDGDDYYLPPPKSPIPAAVIASIFTTASLFFALRALDQKGMFFLSGKRHSAASQAGEVPTLLGLRPEQAREALQGRDLLLTFTAEHDSAKYPVGTVCEQSPLPGSQLPKGSAIQAVLSRGITAIAVPTVAGMKPDDAAKQLVAAGLSLGPARAIASDTVPAGAVAATEPPAGSPVSPAGTVVLVISSGAAEKPVPKVSGMRMQKARELLEQQGFKVGKIRYDSDGDKSSGVVLDQRPAAQAMAPLGALVDLTVNED